MQALIVTLSDERSAQSCHVWRAGVAKRHLYNLFLLILGQSLREMPKFIQGDVSGQWLHVPEQKKFDVKSYQKTHLKLCLETSFESQLPFGIKQHDALFINRELTITGFPITS